MQQGIGIVLLKNLTQSQENNLEQKSESGEVRVKGGWGAEKGFRAGSVGVRKFHSQRDWEAGFQQGWGRNDGKEGLSNHIRVWPTPGHLWFVSEFLCRVQINLLISLGFYKVLKGFRKLLQVVDNLSYLGLARVFHFHLHNLPVVLGVKIYTTHWCSACHCHWAQYADFPRLKMEKAWKHRYIHNPSHTCLGNSR